MIRANVCGVVFERGDKGTIAHYVEAGNAITNLGGRSPYRFSGNPRQSPALINASNPLPNDEQLATAMKALRTEGFSAEESAIVLDAHRLCARIEAIAPPLPTMPKDGELIQAALLDKRTATPRPLWAHVLGAFWGWC